MHRSAGIERYAAVFRFVVGENGIAERIRGEKAVAADMPAGSAGIGGMIENRDAEFLAVDVAIVIHPVGRLAPDVFFVQDAFGVDDRAGRAGIGSLLALFLDDFF